MTKYSKSKCCKPDQCPQGPQGPTGPSGPAGIGSTGPMGNTGAPGVGGIAAYADLYFTYGAVSTIGASASVPFPSNTSLVNISRDPVLTTTVFILPLVGVYLVQSAFTVSGNVTTNLALDSGLGFVDQPQTIYSQASVAGADVMYTTLAMITTTAVNSRLTLKNSFGSGGNLTLPATPFYVGQTYLPTGHLIITKIG